MRLLRQIWQGIKRFFSNLLGLKTPSRRHRGQLAEELPPLTDTDYEFLFMQLLEGVSNGWHEGRIVKFFDKLGTRGKSKDWVPWIERFGAKLYASPSLNQQLAARMIRLGELSQVLPGTVGAIGEVSYRVGRQLYVRDASSSIWEYEGPDDLAIDNVDNNPDDLAIDNVDNNIEQTTANQDGATNTETLTLEELLTRLQQDTNLAASMAHQLGLNTTDPHVIIETLVNQLQSMQAQQKLPETVDEWFQDGLQKAGIANWEGAIQSWEKALEMNPNLASTWHNRGSALAMLGRFHEALESYDRALELDPDDYQICNAKGSALFSLQQWDEALNCWDKVLQLKADFYQGWFNKGSTLEQLGRIAEAISCYQRALEIEPTFELARSRLDNLLSN